MAERVKVRLSTFLACCIAIATAFVLAEGSGWQKKKEQEWEWEEWWSDRETLACFSLLARFYQSSSLPTTRPWGFKRSRSLKRKNEQLLNVFVHTPHPGKGHKEQFWLTQIEGATIIIRMCSRGIKITLEKVMTKKQGFNLYCSSFAPLCLAILHIQKRNNCGFLIFEKLHYVKCW